MAVGSNPGRNLLVIFDHKLPQKIPTNIPAARLKGMLLKRIKAIVE